MKSSIENVLANLVTTHNSLNRRVITGFNYYTTCLQSEDITILTFSNIHSNHAYLSKTIDDLKLMGYPNNEVSMATRDKRGYFLWMPDFYIRDDNNKLEEGLRIKNIQTDGYINLEKIPYHTLKEAGYTAEEISNFIAENEGYEVNISLCNVEDLKRLALLFLRKSSKRLYDEHGEVVFESYEEYEKRNPWPGAWDVPVLIIGGCLSQLQHSISGFQKGFLFRFKDEKVGEYNFVINKEINLLETSEEYRYLHNLGFRKEPCLANIRFIKDYVDVL